MSMPMPSAPSSDRRAPAPAEATLAGAVLLVSSVLSVVFMSHHPTVGAHDTGAMLLEVSEKARLSALVHGALIALLGAETFALFELSGRLGWGRAPVRAAALFYLVGALAMVGAALISGFILPDVAQRFTGDATQATAGESLRQLLGACAITNRTLARFSTVAMSVSFALWSGVLWKSGGPARLVAMLGAPVSVIPAAAILAGALRLEVAGMTAVTVAHGAWCAAAGLLMIRGRAGLATRPSTSGPASP